MQQHRTAQEYYKMLAWSLSGKASTIAVLKPAYLRDDGTPKAWEELSEAQQALFAKECDEGADSSKANGA